MGSVRPFLFPGFGFVTFSSPEQAQAVLAENDQGGLTIRGKRVDPKLVRPWASCGIQKPFHQFDAVPG